MKSLIISLLLLSLVFTKESCDAPVIKKEFWKQPPGSLTGFSVFYSKPEDHGAHLMNIYKMINYSRSEDGCVEYNMFVNPTAPGQIGFVETWAGVPALQKHLAGPHVKGVFEEYYQRDIQTNAALFGPWVEVTELPKQREMVWYWNMNITKQQLWDIITNWSDASWVMGKPKTKLDDDGIQHRIFSNGINIKVRMVEKNQKGWFLVEETVDGLTLPGDVHFPTFFVNMSMTNEDDGAVGIDPESQVRFRYHTRFTVREGDDPTAAIQALKDDFVSRMKYYQDEFDRKTQYVLRLGYRNVVKALNAFGKDKATYLSFFEGKARVEAEKYLDSLKGTVQAVQVVTPISSPVNTVVSVEDILETTLDGTKITNRIVFYHTNDEGKVESFESYHAHSKAQAGIKEAAEKYYEATKKDIDAVRPHFTEDAVLQDPVGWADPRSFDSVFTNFFTLGKKVNYKFHRFNNRIYAVGNKVVSLVKSDFDINGETRSSFPVQVLTFNEHNKITHFQAFFKPAVMNFSNKDHVVVN